MEQILQYIVPVLIGSGVVGVLGVYLIRLLFSEVNINKLTKDIDKLVDDIQLQEKSVGVELRSKLIFASKSLIKALEE